MKQNIMGKGRFWALILMIGFVGQLAWAVENQYINLWVFSQSQNAAYITWMTAASSVVATVATFLIGALSDKLGKRKLFISLGYTIWGVFVFAFALMSLSNMKALAGGDLMTALLLVGIANVIIDCLMTFFGSSANDACFNAWVTDNTNEHNRPLVESILSVLPLIATAAMVVLGGVLGLEKETDPNAIEETASSVAGNWLIFFLIFGALTTIVGILCFFLMPKDNLEPKRENYFKSLAKGFTPSSIKSYPDFYIALIAFLFFNTAVNSFMPYYLVYFTSTLNLDNFYPAMAIILGGSMVICVVFGFFMDKIGKLKLLIPGVVAMGLGALLLFFAQDAWWPAVLSATLMMTGYLIGTAVLGATIRDETNTEAIGALQGVRMIFAVLIPMIVGSNISLAVFSNQTTSATGSVLYPDRNMFIVTAVAASLAIIPSVFLIVRKVKRNNLEQAKKEESESE
ncbi:MAG: MFS transporter [Bacilli bacterium]|nr:MFS transporter [Bacilli bacterium]